MSAGRLPLWVVTGALGSGKTTLIARALAGAGPGLAVVVNELGDVALDHELLQRTDEVAVPVGGGCACCARREDLVAALLGLLRERDLRGVVVETSGVADPGPILFTLATHPVLVHQFRLAGVACAVDAVAGPAALAAPAAARQLAAADRVLVTKGDLADPGPLRAAVAARNPAAEVVTADALLREGEPAVVAGAAPAAHGDAPEATSVRFDGPVDWAVFSVWLSMLLHAHGARVLRVKGLLDVGGPGPVSINAVGHVVHPPAHLDAWPGERTSRLVVIARGLDPDALRASLAAFRAGLTAR